MAVPLERFEPVFNEFLLLKTLGHRLAPDTDRLNFLVPSLYATESCTFLRLLHRHAEFDQSLNLPCKELVANIGLIGDYLLPQGFAHLDALVLEEDLRCATRSFNHLTLW